MILSISIEKYNTRDENTALILISCRVVFLFFQSIQFGFKIVVLHYETVYNAILIFFSFYKPLALYNRNRITHIERKISYHVHIISARTTTTTTKMSTEVGYIYEWGCDGIKNKMLRYISFQCKIFTYLHETENIIRQKWNEEEHMQCERSLRDIFHYTPFLQSIVCCETFFPNEIEMRSTFIFCLFIGIEDDCRWHFSLIVYISIYTNDDDNSDCWR